MPARWVDGVNEVLRSRTGRQTVSLYGSQLALLVMGVATTSLHARVLGPADYGVLAFYLTFTRFVVAFTGFGFSGSSALLLARASDERAERRMVGTTLAVTLAIGLFYAALVFAASFGVDGVFDTRVGPILRASAPLLVILPFEPLMAQLVRGTNRIQIQAAFNLTSRTLYLAALLGLLWIGSGFSVLALVLLQLAALGVAVATAAARLRPVFDALNDSWRRLASTNREYGIHVYAGQVVNQTTYRLDGILITLFRDTTSLGFYSLATALVSPMALFSQSLSSSLFKGFASRPEIPRKVFLVNTAWLVAGVTGLVLLGGPAVTLLFGGRFAEVTPLLLPLAAAGFCTGMYQPYGFLAAKGKGEWIRRTALVEGGINILANLILIYHWGAMGAAIASALAKLAHWQMLAYYYRCYRSGEAADA